MTYGYGNAQELLKIVYDTDDIQSLIPEHISFWKRWQTYKEGPAPGGKMFNFPVNVGWPDSASR